jgi:hypothetical protein
VTVISGEYSWVTSRAGSFLLTLRPESRTPLSASEECSIYERA